VDWPLLQEVPEEDRRRILAVGVRRRFGRREVLFHEGDPGESMHLIASGRVAVRITTPLGDVATLSVLGRGAVVGELALVDDQGMRSATAVALEPTETVALQRSEFDELRRRHPSVHRFLVRALAREVRRLDAQLIEALYVPADTRVVRRLLELAEMYRTPGGYAVVPLTQDELASLAGTSRATVNRVLGQAQASGAIELGRGRVHVLETAPLERRAR
jgi:CRP/FNR family transcriptional regulator, cyclic AMP receptor protein